MFDTSQELDLEATPPANDARVSYHFAIRADAEPSVLSRVIELFSILSVVPDAVQSRRAGENLDELRIDVMVTGITVQRVQHLQLQMAQFPTVINVLVDKDVEVASDLDYREAVYQMRRKVREAG